MAGKFGTWNDDLKIYLERPEYKEIEQKKLGHQCNKSCIMECPISEKTLKKLVKTATKIHANKGLKLNHKVYKLKIYSMVMASLKKKFSFDNTEVMEIKKRLLILIQERILINLILNLK